MKIEARIQEMGQDEIKGIIPGSEYDRIRAFDPHPEFRAYAIAHEGESTGGMSVDGMRLGKVIKRWAKQTIERIHAKLAMGTPIFHLHGGSENSHDGRRSIGEVVGRALREIGGRLHAIAAVYIKPEYRSTPLDIASIEADVVYQGPDREIEVRDVTGIALGSSSMLKPGFAGAKLLAVIQEFAEKNYEDGRTQMTAAEIQKLIREAGLQPSDLYSAKTLQDDPIVTDHIRERISQEYARRKRAEDDLDKMKGTMTSDHEKELTALKTENSSLKSTTLRIQAKDKLPIMIKTRKLEPTQEKFILAKFDTFVPKETTTLDSDLNQFLDAQIKDFDNTAEILGLKKKTPEKGVGSMDALGLDAERPELSEEQVALEEQLIPKYI